MEGRKACRISEERPGDVADAAEHPERIECFLDGGARFRSAIAAVGSDL